VYTATDGKKRKGLWENSVFVGEPKAKKKTASKKKTKKTKKK